MKNCECYCVTEVDGEYIPDCERYGYCDLGDERWMTPEEMRKNDGDKAEGNSDGNGYLSGA